MGGEELLGFLVKGSLNERSAVRVAEDELNERGRIDTGESGLVILAIQQPVPQRFVHRSSPGRGREGGRRSRGENRTACRFRSRSPSFAERCGFAPFSCRPLGRTSRLPGGVACGA